MKNQPEYELQKAICYYLETQYKDVLFLSDTVASVKLTFPQQARNKKIQKHGFACPDLLILEPRNGYNGLFIELKIVPPFKKDGTLKKSDHLENQQRTIDQLKKKGYLSCFSWGFENTKKIIDNYLK